MKNEDALDSLITRANCIRYMLTDLSPHEIIKLLQTVTGAELHDISNINLVDHAEEMFRNVFAEVRRNIN